MGDKWINTLSRSGVCLPFAEAKQLRYFAQPRIELGALPSNHELSMVTHAVLIHQITAKTTADPAF